MSEPSKSFLDRFRQFLDDRQAQLDDLLSKKFTEGVEKPRIKNTLRYAEALAHVKDNVVRSTIERNPWLNERVQQASARRDLYEKRSFEEKTHLGKDWGKFQHSVADLLGVDVHKTHPSISVSKSEIEMSEKLLYKVIAPIGLFSILLGPIARETIYRFQMESDYRAKKNSEQHQNLETEQGRIIKNALGLPYREHSIVDLFKALKFQPKKLEEFIPLRPKINRPKLESEGFSAVWRGSKKRPTLYINNSTADQAIGAFGGILIPSSPEAASEALHSLSPVASEFTKTPNPSYPPILVRGEFSRKDTLSLLRHEHLHAQQFLTGEFEESNLLASRKALEKSPHFQSFRDGLVGLGYPEQNVPFEIAAYTSASGIKETGLTREQSQDLVYRYADDLLRRRGRDVGEKIFSTALPSARGLFRTLADFSQADRDEIADTIGSRSFESFVEPVNSTETVARRVACHVNLETPTGQFLKGVLNLPYKQHSIVDILKGAHFNPEASIPTIFRRERPRLGQPGIHGVWRGKSLNDAIANFRSMRKSHTERALDFRKQAREAAIPVHNNLETPNVPRKELWGDSDPYKEHSTIEMPKVALFFDELAKTYPSLIGKTRTVFQTYYNLQTQVYEYFAQHPNKVLSTIARSLIYAEMVEHRFDPIYQFSPTRRFSSFYRAVMGITHRSYGQIALRNIEDGAEHLLTRRIVRTAGGIIGILEAIHSMDYTIHEFERIYRYLFPQRDPESRKQRILDKERRQEYREARRRGERYDPTQPARRHESSSSHSTPFETIKEELINQFSIRHQLRYVRDVLSDPKDHLPSIIMYGYFLGSIGKMVKHSVEKTEGKELGERLLAIGGEFFHTQTRRMQMVTAAGAVGGIVFGRSMQERAGSFANLGATLLADWIGGWFGQKFVESEKGQEFASLAYQRGSEFIKYFLELKQPWAVKLQQDLQRKSDILAGKAVEGLLASEREIALKQVRDVAAKAGMEVGGILLEGSFLIPIRHILQRVAHAIDRGNAFNHARKLGRKYKPQRREEKDKDLRVYLSSYSAPAYSPQDIYTNPYYSSEERGALMLLNQTDTGKQFLDGIGTPITILRRIRSGSKLLSTNPFEKGHKESWQMGLSRTYTSPAFSDSDISSNPQYSVPERLFLFEAKKTDTGSKILEHLSDPTTKIRRFKAFMEGLRNHGHEHILKEHLRHGHKHEKKEIPDNAFFDTVEMMGSVGSKTGEVINNKVQEQQKKRTLKIKARTHSYDLPPDEKQLHAAYSRYIDYGHEGDALQYRDNDFS